MKIKFVTAGLGLLLIPGFILTGCQSNERKEEMAKENVATAKENLNEVRASNNEDAEKAANEQEWKEFKMEANAKIEENNEKISEIRLKLVKPGTTMDPIYEKRIKNLETKNANLQAKVEEYEKSQSDYEAFKREFNADMDELGQSFKDFSKDNVK